eukprot:357798-Chlamydomonas_euryale.AAC.13
MEAVTIQRAKHMALPQQCFTVWRISHFLCYAIAWSRYLWCRSLFVQLRGRLVQLRGARHVRGTVSGTATTELANMGDRYTGRPTQG